MDPFYRYKIPEPDIKYVGNKTSFENLTTVSKKLGRESEHILKFFAYELGTGFVVKNDAYFLNGNYPRSVIQASLDKFVSMYVNCGTCSNPETILQKGKLRCKACGASTLLNPNHKWSQYITKVISR